MAMIRGIEDGRGVPAKSRSCVLYHRLVTGAVATLLRFFSGVDKATSGVGVTNLDNVGRIGVDRNFILCAIAFDPVGVAAADVVDLLSFQHGEAIFSKNGDTVVRSAVRAIGSVGGPGVGFIDAASAGTTSELTFGGGPLVLHEPEPLQAGDSIELTVDMAAALGTTRNILASLLGFEVVAVD